MLPAHVFDPAGLRFCFLKIDNSGRRETGKYTGAEGRRGKMERKEGGKNKKKGRKKIGKERKERR